MSKQIGDSIKRKWFDYINILILIITAFIALYPFWNVLITSLNDPTNTLKGQLYFLPRKFTLSNFASFFSGYDMGPIVFRSVARTVIGALSSVLFTAMFAYSVSKKYLRGQKVYITLMLIPMYIGGGLIPTFLLIKSLGLYQNFLVYIIPLLFSSYNALIMFTSFKSLPAELEESVRIDGGNDLTIFFRIVIPISKPLFATIILFNAVGQWNSWFDTLLYGGNKLMTLQGLLVTIMRDVNQAKQIMSSMNTTASATLSKPTVQSVTATATIITAIPIIMVYPFLQKHFVKGVMIGSLKQ